MVIKAVLCDLDGVLVVTPNLHKDALNFALREVEGFELTDKEHNDRFNGLPTRTKLEILANEQRVCKNNFEIIFALKQSQTFNLIIETVSKDSDIISVGAHWKSIGLRRVCVTNAIYASALLMLDQVGILPYIQNIISADQLSAPKPNPAGYITAMKYADVKPEECIIIEDSPKGIEAAERSGCPNIWQVTSPAELSVGNFKRFMDSINDR